MVRTQAHRGTPAGYGPTGRRGAEPDAASRHEAAPTVVAGGAAAERVAAVTCGDDADELEVFRREEGANKGARPARKGCGSQASSPAADPMAGTRRGCGRQASSLASDLLAGKGLAGGYGPAGTRGTCSELGGGVAAGCAVSMASTPSGPGHRPRVTTS